MKHVFFSKTGEYKSVSQNQGVGPNLTKMYPNSGAHIDPQTFLTVFLPSSRQTGDVDLN